MNDIIYEILDAATCLITGSNAYMFILNIILSVCSMFPSSDCLTAFDLSGNSSKYSRFCPVFHDISDMIDILTNMQQQLDNGKNSQKWLIINHLDEIINNIYVSADKKQFLQLLSDVLYRGSSAGLHVIIIISNKYTIPVISGIDCRVYAGKCDKKTAQKFFGADAAALSIWDMPDSEQALARIDGDIYKINVPNVEAAAAFDTPIAAATAPQEAAEHVKPETMPQQETTATAAATQAAEAEESEPEQAAAENIIVRLLQNILWLILDIISSISGIITDNFIIKFAVILSITVLNIVAIPVKLVHCLARSGFPGGFMALCIVYMTVSTLL